MFWIKQFGRADDDWWEHFVVNPDAITMEFSKGRPSISLGDTVVFTGIHVTKIIFAGECIAEAYPPTPEELMADPWREQFYWKLDFANLFPHFAEHWNIHALDPYQLADMFRAANPDVPLLHNHGITLDGLRTGHSHLKLSDQFGIFLLDSIEGHN